MVVLKRLFNFQQFLVGLKIVHYSMEVLKWSMDGTGDDVLLPNTNHKSFY